MTHSSERNHQQRAGVRLAYTPGGKVWAASPISIAAHPFSIAAPPSGTELGGNALGSSATNRRHMHGCLKVPAGASTNACAMCPGTRLLQSSTCFQRSLSACVVCQCEYFVHHFQAAPSCAAKETVRCTLGALTQRSVTPEENRYVRMIIHCYLVLYIARSRHM
jgi:hypothetical protein